MMEVIIKEKRKDPLFNRVVVEGIVVHAGEKTPERKQLLGVLSKELSHDANLIVVRKLLPKFGDPESSFVAHVYENEKDMKDYEPEHLFKRVKSDGKEKEATREEGQEEAR